MIEYKDLSVYEKELINKIIDKFTLDTTYVDFKHSLSSILHKDCIALVQSRNITMVQLDKFSNWTVDRLTEFFVENDFVKKRIGGAEYDRLANGDKLRKAGSVEKYYETHEQERIKQESRFTPHITQTPINRKTPSNSFINISRLKELNNIPIKKFSLVILIKICEEINICFSSECYIATIILTRALLDHVPPIFGKTSFSEVANNYGTKSIRDAMLHLENSSRKIADLYLHNQIKKDGSLPNDTQVNFSQSIDLLLAEIIINLNTDPVKSDSQKGNEPPQKKERSIKFVQNNSEVTSIEDIAKELKRTNELNNKREAILKSNETIQNADNAVGYIFDNIKKKVMSLRAENFSFWELSRPNTFKDYFLQLGEHSFSIKWDRDVEFNTTNGRCIKNDSKLIIELYVGQILNNDNSIDNRRIKIKSTSTYTYIFDIKENAKELGWKEYYEKEFYSDDNLIEKCLRWILIKEKERNAILR